MPTATFAQICQNLATVEDSSATVFDLYHDISGTDPSGFSWQTAATTFISLFYDKGLFRIRDCCDNIMLLHNWIVDPSGDISNNAIPFGTDPSNCHLIDLVTNQWILDASNNCGLDISANWGTCSKMGILRELLKARSLCNWDCKVCCALTAQEIADVLNYQELDDDGAWTGDFIRTAENPVTLGDTLILSVLFTNQNPCVDPIELRLHFLIGWMDDWLGVSANRNPQISPGSGEWAAADIRGWPGGGAGIEGRPVNTEQIWIDLSNCVGFSSQTPVGVQGGLNGGILTIRGWSNNCPNDDISVVTANFVILQHLVPGWWGRGCQLQVMYQSGSGSLVWGQNLLGEVPHYTFSFQDP